MIRPDPLHMAAAAVAAAACRRHISVKNDSKNSLPIEGIPSKQLLERMQRFGSVQITVRFGSGVHITAVQGATGSNPKAV